MAKSSTIYVCNNCGNESAKWFGRCPACGEWNTMQEFELSQTQKSKLKNQKFDNSKTKPQKLGKISGSSLTRISTGMSELDRVLGGQTDPSASSGQGLGGRTDPSASSGQGSSMGIVPGSVILISGDPGIGKSTLMLQLAINLSGSSPDKELRNKKQELRKNNKNHLRVLYISGEESEAQIAHRAERIIDKSKLQKHR